VLDADHYGLEKVKDRIVEYLAVQTRANKLTGRSCALVGLRRRKTRLAQSIARATGANSCASRSAACATRPRSAVTAALYRLDARQIIQSMRKAKTSNPLFLLDEIDKMGADFAAIRRRLA